MNIKKIKQTAKEIIVLIGLIATIVLLIWWDRVRFVF